jgi:putative peptidoglycan lipid II flippase
LLIVGAYFAALHTANRRFFLAALSATIPYAVVLTTVVVLGSAIGVRAIAVGMLLGSAGSVLALYVTISNEFDVAGMDTGEESQVVNSFTRSLPFLVVAMTTFAAYPLVDAYWGSRLGEGAVSYLGYAQRILIAIGGLVAAGPFAILASRFVESNNSGGRQLNEAMLSSLHWLVIVLSPIALILAVLAERIVMILLQRGQFTADSSRYVALLLMLMSPGMVAMVCGTILFRGFFARNDYRNPAFIGLIWTIAYATLGGALSSFMDVRGLAVAYSVVWALTLLIGLRLFLREDFKTIVQLHSAGVYLAKLLATVAITWWIAKEVRDYLMEPSASYAMISLISRSTLVALVALAIFGLVSWKIKLVP